MVYYFTSTAVDPPAFVYVGKDKFESEFPLKLGAGVTDTKQTQMRIS